MKKGVIQNSGNYVTFSPEFSNKTIWKKGNLINQIIYNKNNKIAQVSVFIIVAIVIGAIIIGGGLTFYSNENDIEYFSSSEIKNELEKVQGSVLECSDVTAEDSLYLIGFQGGYYKDPSKKVNFIEEDEGIFIPYYYNEGEILIPTKENIEKELENYFDENILYCLDSLNFSEITINYKKPVTDVVIEDKQVSFNSNLRIQIKKDGHVTFFDMKEYPIHKNSALDDIYDVAEYITESHKDNPAMFCINCVADMAEKKNLYVDISLLTDVLTLVTISENYTSSDPYLFMFLNKYTGKEAVPNESGSEASFGGGQKGE